MDSRPKIEIALSGQSRRRIRLRRRDRGFGCREVIGIDRVGPQIGQGPLTDESQFRLQRLLLLPVARQPQ